MGNPDYELASGSWVKRTVGKATQCRSFARGRLVGIVTLEHRTDLEYDDDANREAVDGRSLFATAWQAVTLPHGLGFEEAGGWAANVTMSPGQITYGPYPPY